MADSYPAPTDVECPHMTCDDNACSVCKELHRLRKENADLKAELKEWQRGRDVQGRLEFDA